MERSNVAPLLALYVGYLLVATFHPFVLAGNSAWPATRFLAEFLAVRAPGTKDFVENVWLFIPFGALLYWCLKSPQRSRTAVTVYALCTGCALSLAIEIGQLYFTRDPSVFDVVANSVGAGSGAFIANLFPVRINGVLARSWERFVTSATLLFCVLLYGTLPMILALIQWPWPNFQTWDSGLPFQLANEATRDRPWVGRIYLVALYNRALSPPEIANNFHAGFAGDAMKMRAESGLVVLYTFVGAGGDIVRDVSGFGSHLNLFIEPQSQVRWLASNGIEITRPAIIKSQGAATKLAKAFRHGDEISIEAWFVPGNLTQKGLARLVSFSGDLQHHNFTLGQENTEIVFWLRTLIAGGRSAPQALATNSRVLTRETFHVVATYAKGMERLYINGVQYPSVLDVTKDVVIGFATAKQPVAQIAYSFFYFFPLALFFSIFLSSRTNGLASSLLLPFMAAAGLQGITEIVQAIVFQRAVDYPLIGYGLIVAAIGSLIGAAFLMSQVDKRMDLACLSAKSRMISTRSKQDIFKRPWSRKRRQ